MAITWPDLKGHGAEPSAAKRVLVGVGSGSEQYVSVRALVDAEAGQIHLFSADGKRHLASSPIANTLVEWEDVQELHGV